MTKIFETPTLETERLVLRPHTLSDCESLQKYFNNWNIIKNLNGSVPWPYPTDGQKNHFAQTIVPTTKDGSAYGWVICLKEAPEHALGCINYRYKNSRPENGDRGFWLAEPHWGKGYMSEAVKAVNNFAFDILKADKMVLTNRKSNIGSRRVKEKTGATYIKTILENYVR